MDKKKEYEEEISDILRKVMETSYQRKRNSEKIISLLKTIRQEGEPEELSESLINEYAELKRRVLNNLGIQEKD
ncbi:hypothetical protein NEPAR06_0534 [Nematocida parisii]|uniref:Uncharacterized protein n=1 Tax=Nematocida parisii (strain ERTm3) TaxID=935791 RepID=I3EI89_NEMP3|nr:uncharacterized protein NEPG_01852 [Nematocida parisii ERTm1]EIJ88936.1 hypothetical protein NEQG_00755 [Nematocida parisii ERTm3]KAI5126254.1 hypothetical protein NEPAR08_0325 [Nematocida parisii]EIJ93510.1 hypothetical protein NEPG_01852 [Nematocida parisii ERTm1]KAI5127121.1 hypothetical protein NEPAR03_0788 [Nematocida parisii]KAI5140034.1 hypothetical protein NEPAR04_0008 [Nematocida parisii]|eukprot:XP_013059680.1 hypothetical protein NEPG_01852 [Nematocida parisii ERTm1]